MGVVINISFLCELHEYNPPRSVEITEECLGNTVREAFYAPFTVSMFQEKINLTHSLSSFS